LSSDFSSQAESGRAQIDDNVDNDYATDSIWMTPVEDGDSNESGTVADVPIARGAPDDLLADTVDSSEDSKEFPDEILHDGSAEMILF
jgi:hypothetical protein